MDKPNAKKSIIKVINALLELSEAIDNEGVDAQQYFEPVKLEDTFMGLEETAKFLGITRPTLRKMCDNNEIPFMRTGNRYKFSKRKILEMVR